MKDINKISFLGLGVMGYPMAGHLSRKSGAEVTVYNRTLAKAEKWKSEFDGKTVETPAEAAQDADLLCICVGNDDDLREVLTGKKGVIATIKPGAMIVDHTTVSARISREMYALFKEKGVSFIDAPVSGGQAGAENGALTIMCGGDRAAFEKIEPLLRTCYAKQIKLMGESGAGQLTKMVNQICIAGLLQGLSEGLAFGMKAGLPMDSVIDVISEGAAGSWQMKNRGKTMARGEFDFGFALDWMIKDLGIALEEAAQNHADLSETKRIFDFYQELSGEGYGRKDTSALIKRLTK